MNGEYASINHEATIAVPVVRSTSHHTSSRLAACIGMAVAYARNDRHGDRYRDLLELCLRDHALSVDTVIGLARGLFPDVPISDYRTDELELDDVVTLAQLAAQRGGRVLPVLVYDQRFQDMSDAMRMDAVVLSTFHPEDRAKRSFWDAEPRAVHGWHVSSRVESVPSGFACLMFGWLPPSVSH